MRTVTVFSIPSTLKNNSYLELLYGAIDGKEQDSVRFTVKPFSFRALVSEIGKGRKAIVHVHWETNIYGSRSRVYSILKMVVRFSLLYIARAKGARFIWTMHNLHAHDYPHPVLDRLGRFLMRNLASAIIIQNQEGAETFAKQYPRAKVIYIPHGNYIGAYGPAIADQKEARVSLNLPVEGMILLSLGTIRPYKKLEVLIDVARDKNISLIIAGKGEEKYIQSLRDRIGDAKNIQLRADFVPDAQIPEYLEAADFAIFAHGDSSLTSGALLLALSYGTPVITFPMPAAEVVTEGVNGYVVQDTAALSELLSRIQSLPAIDRSAVVGSVSSFSWDRAGKETMELYHRTIEA